MTKISIPIPTSPIGYVDINGQRLPVIAPREWYRYFGLLFSAVGGETDVLETANLDLAGAVLAMTALVADLQRRIADLESMQRSQEPIPYRDIADLHMLVGA